MREYVRTAVVVILTALSCVSAVYAWQVEYNASTGMLPTEASPAWELGIDDGVVPTVSDGILRMQYVTYGQGVQYARERGIKRGVPVTLEARLRVTQDASRGAASVIIDTVGGSALLQVYTGRITVDDWGHGYLTYNRDFTTFRTIRFAYDGGTRAYAWVDSEFAFSWGLLGNGQIGIAFGTPFYAEGESDSYWQYVAYSKEFLPIPEPSSLLALAAGIGGLGLGLVRRPFGGAQDRRRV